jgi:hypothetical protein
MALRLLGRSGAKTLGRTLSKVFQLTFETFQMLVAILLFKVSKTVGGRGIFEDGDGVSGRRGDSYFLNFVSPPKNHFLFICSSPYKSNKHIFLILIN